MTSKLHIDPEFRDKIPPLTDEEYKQLEENILADGEVIEPIAVWNGTIVDGHNRWKIICDHWDELEDHYKVKEMDFPDKWAAFEWMYKRQLGRRNMTEAQRAVLIAKMYQASKRTEKFKGNQYTAESGVDQNDPHQNKPRSTAEAIAREVGVSEPTVKRYERFSKGIDALSDVSKEAADKVLSGEAEVSKKTIIAFPRMEPSKQEELAESILLGTEKETQNKLTNELHEKPVKAGGLTKEAREKRNQLIAIVAEARSNEIVEYTIEMLESDIEANGERAVNVLRLLVSERDSLLVGDNIKRVADKLDNIINEINTIKDNLGGNKK